MHRSNPTSSATCVDPPSPSATQGRPSGGGLTRRDILKSTAGSFLLIGAGFVAARDAAWAAEVSVLSPRQMASLVQLARDIYPHDRIPDKYYLIAVRGYDAIDSLPMIEAGLADLDRRARRYGVRDYLNVKWERQRTDLLREIEDDVFFQTIRGGLVTGLYNQKAIWPLFGYEGESFSKGGYLDRGFDDIEWL